jgi:hypothetical protein
VDARTVVESRRGSTNLLGDQGIEDEAHVLSM